VHDAGPEIKQERLMLMTSRRWWPALCTLLVLLIAAISPGHGRLGAAEATLDETNQVSIDGQTFTVNGTWNGQPFWARLLKPDPHFGNHRVLQLLWTPPLPSDLDGVHLADCPFLLLDEQARVVAWNGRDSISQITPSGADSYKVSRELSRKTGTDTQPVVGNRTIGGGRGWDLHLAPLLLALSWKAGSNAHVHVIDFFGSHAAEKMSAQWHDQEAVINSISYHITADALGHLAKMTDASGALCLEVASRQIEGQP
jgi:hypothetical protein